MMSTKTTTRTREIFQIVMSAPSGVSLSKVFEDTFGTYPKWVRTSNDHGTHRGVTHVVPKTAALVFDGADRLELPGGAIAMAWRVETHHTMATEVAEAGETLRELVNRPGREAARELGRAQRALERATKARHRLRRENRDDIADARAELADLRGIRNDAAKARASELRAELDRLDGGDKLAAAKSRLAAAEEAVRAASEWRRAKLDVIKTTRARQSALERSVAEWQRGGRQFATCAQARTFLRELDAIADGLDAL